MWFAMASLACGMSAHLLRHMHYISTFFFLPYHAMPACLGHRCPFQSWLLPMDIKKRMAALFKKQAVWGLDEIAPFIACVAYMLMAQCSCLPCHAIPYTASSALNSFLGIALS